LLGNVLNLRDLTAQDVMIPRVDIIAIPQTVGEEELLNTMTSSRLKQVLVYKETLDDIVGMVQLKDVMGWMVSKKPFSLKSLIREVLFVSPAMGTLDLLLQMRASGTKVALVVDEYGGIDGLVTVADLIEEIIGDIQDAQDHAKQPYLNKRSDGVIIADGRVDLEQLEEEFALNLVVDDLDDDIETVGGLVAALAGRVPPRGKLVRHPNGIELEVVDADLRRVKRVHIHPTRKK
jgi:CBS domain containing-hemolysin-like protein